MSIEQIIILALAAVLTILLAVIAIRAILLGHHARETKQEFDYDTKLRAERKTRAVRHLSQLITCETISYRESVEKEKEFQKLHRLLARFYPKLHETSQMITFDNALMLRWKGKHPKEAPIVLMAHMDVVEAGGIWQHPPFAGDVDPEGNIWGRGAVDCKATLCAIFEAAEALAKEDFKPDRDIYIFASDSEEIMGSGALRAVQYLRSSGITPALVVDEGGFIQNEPMPGLTGLYAMVGVAEKGYGEVKLTAISRGGHASLPQKNTPLVRLGQLMVYMDNHNPFKRNYSPEVRKMLASMAKDKPFRSRLLYANLWLFGGIVAGQLAKKAPSVAALLATTCNFTMAEGSAAANVIPSAASVTANLRFSAHENMDVSLAKLEAIAKKFDVDIQSVVGHDSPEPSVFSGPSFQLVRSTIETVFPGVGVVPSGLSAATDGRYFTSICPCCVRFSPLFLTPAQRGALHGVDEHISAQSLFKAIDFYTELITGCDKLQDVSEPGEEPA